MSSPHRSDPLDTTNCNGAGGHFHGEGHEQGSKGGSAVHWVGNFLLSVEVTCQVGQGHGGSAGGGRQLVESCVSWSIVKDLLVSYLQLLE